MQGTIINGQVRQGRERPAELFKHFGPNVYRAAYQEGCSLSVYLEAQDPSESYNDRFDAYERLLHIAGVRPRSNMAAGSYASEWGVFDTSPQHRSLVPEFIFRAWREIQYGQSASTRAIYSSADDIPGSSLRPYVERPGALPSTPNLPPIMLSDIVAITSPIASNAYRAVYLTSAAAQQRMVRIAEGGEIPRAKLATSQNTINLLKYGRGLQATYESLRRTRIDKVRFWLQMLARQTEQDKVSQAIYVLVSGDGNSNSASNWRAQTDFDSTATGKALTLKAWLNYKLKFFPNFTLTHVFGAEADTLKLLLLNIGSAGASVPTYMFDVTNAPGYANRTRDGVTYGVTANVPSDAFVGIDATQALERVVEIGSNIEEIERWAVTQEQVLTMTEVEAYAILQPGACLTLTLES